VFVERFRRQPTGPSPRSIFRAARRGNFVFLVLSAISRGSRGKTMSKNLYVGNLPFTTTDDSLREAFAAYGNVVKAQVIMDRETGRSRGFGFVEMADGADEAVAAMNGAQFEGRTLTVNEAKPREPRSGGGGGGYGGGGGGRGGYGGGGGGGGRGGYGGGGGGGGRGPRY
jgi:hypothetical protein